MRTTPWTRVAGGLVTVLLLTGLDAGRAPAATLVGRTVLLPYTFSVGPRR